MRNIDALNMLHNLVEQISLTGKDRDQARAAYGQLAECIQKADSQPEPKKAK